MSFIIVNNLSFPSIPSSRSSPLGCLGKTGKVGIGSCVVKKDYCLVMLEAYMQTLTHLFLLRTSRFTKCSYPVTTQEVCTLMKKKKKRYFSVILFFSGHECTVSETFDISKTLIVKHSKETEIYNGYNNLSSLLE